MNGTRKKFDVAVNWLHKAGMTVRSRILGPIHLPSSAGRILTAGLILFACAGCLHQRIATDSQSRLMYPVARRTNQVDEYHGVKVADAYRWLEDLDAAETKAWVGAENKVTFAYLDQISARPAIKQRLTQLWNYERYGIPFKQGNRYFITR